MAHQQLISRMEFQRRIGVNSCTTFYERIASHPACPKPVRLSTRTKLYPEDEVDDFILALKAERDSDEDAAAA